MNDKAIVSTATLALSLLAYWYAREAQKDVVPYVMIGGFVGSIVGEILVEKKNDSSNN